MKVSLLILLLSAIFFSACSDSSTTDEMPELSCEPNADVLDQPHISALVPEAGSFDIEEDTLIKVYFSREMDVTTVTEDTIFLKKSGTKEILEGSVSYDSETNIATLTPGEKLLSVTEYELYVLSTIRDIHCMKLPSDTIALFNTGSYLEMSYDLTFDINAYNVIQSPWPVIDLRPGDPVELPLPEDAEKENDGYIFTGWNTAQDGSGTSYSKADTFIMGPKETTLYAQWSKSLPLLQLPIMITLEVPGMIYLNNEDDTGESDTDCITAQTSGLGVYGKAAAKTRYNIYKKTTKLIAFTVDRLTSTSKVFTKPLPVNSSPFYSDSYGNWKTDITLPEGKHTLYLAQVDKYGNIISKYPSEKTITVDTHLEPALTFGYVESDFQNIVYPENNNGYLRLETYNTHNLTFYGTAEPYSHVVLKGGSAEGNMNISTHADANGLWRVNASLPAGVTDTAYLYRPTVEDRAGNTDQGDMIQLVIKNPIVVVSVDGAKNTEMIWQITRLAAQRLWMDLDDQFNYAEIDSSDYEVHITAIVTAFFSKLLAPLALIAFAEDEVKTIKLAINDRAQNYIDMGLQKSDINLVIIGKSLGGAKAYDALHKYAYNLNMYRKVALVLVDAHCVPPCDEDDCNEWHYHVYFNCNTEDTSKSYDLAWLPRFDDAFNTSAAQSDPEAQLRIYNIYSRENYDDKGDVRTIKGYSFNEAYRNLRSDSWGEYDYNGDDYHDKEVYNLLMSASSDNDHCLATIKTPF